VSAPTVVELRELARQLYVSLSEHRVSTGVIEAEITPTEEAMKAAAAVVSDLDDMISARKNKAQEGA